jgi:hypothetical protein
LQKNHAVVHVDIFTFDQSCITIFHSSDGKQSITDEQQTIANLKEEIITLKSVLTNTQKNIQEVWNFFV